jgi:signal transduction histidine kinase
MTTTSYDQTHSEAIRSADVPSARVPLDWPVSLPKRVDGLFISVVIALVTTIWAVINLLNGWSGFAMLVPEGYRGGSEAAISLARLFAALVLVLIAADATARRLQWVASGFLALGLGQLVFGYLEPLIAPTTDSNDAIYQMVFVRSLAAALFIVGLVPANAPRIDTRTLGIIGIASVAVVIAFWFFDRLGVMPTLVRTEDMSAATQLRIAPLSWMTPWHWILAVPPFALAVVAAWGAIKRNLEGQIAIWLPLAIVVLAASELHDSFWPSAYGTSMIVNTADILRLIMAGMVAIGGAFELRTIAVERNRLLAAERDRSRHLEELHRLKSDFTAMIAHELGQPLSAIRRQAEMLSLADLDRTISQQAVTEIIKETDVLNNRVADMNTTAETDRDDFRTRLRPVPLQHILDDARAIANAHSPNRQLDISTRGVSADDLVLADPDRIGQVLRNLLCNAAKYSPADARISLSIAAGPQGNRRVEVRDSGPGIDANDQTRIFEKFIRGTGRNRSREPGKGLGLYLSRRIVRAHGSDLTVRSTLGKGSVFSFELTGVDRVTT